MALRPAKIICELTEEERKNGKIEIAAIFYPKSFYDLVVSRVRGWTKKLPREKHFYLQSCTFVDQFVQAALKRTLSVSIKSINTPAEQHKTDESAGDTSTQHKLF